MTDRPSIVNVGYRSTNFWVVSAGRQRLRMLGARTVHAGHGPVRPMPVIWFLETRGAHFQ